MGKGLCKTERIRKARSTTMEEALTPRPQNANKRVPMVITYHPGLSSVCAILRELQPLLQFSDKRRKAVADIPMVAFRRPKSLGDYLVHAKLRPPRSEDITVPKGTVNCSDRRCNVCEYLKIGNKFRRGSRILKWGVNFCNNVIEPKPG